MMSAAVSKSKPTTLGRPRTSALTRTEQLRPAKRAQRERDAKAEIVEVRRKLPRALAQRLALAARQPGFVDALTHFLESQIIDADDYPELKLLCWNGGATYSAQKTPGAYTSVTRAASNSRS